MAGSACEPTLHDLRAKVIEAMVITDGLDLTLIAAKLGDVLDQIDHLTANDKTA